MAGRVSRYRKNLFEASHFALQSGASASNNITEEDLKVHESHNLMNEGGKRVS